MGMLFVLAATPASLMSADVDAWAAPEGYKIDKFGKKIFTQDAKAGDIAALKKKSSIWDGEAKAISLSGARGEVLAFQLAIEGGAQGLKEVDVKKGALSGPAGKTIPDAKIELYKIYYTQVTDKGSGATNSPSLGKGWYPDALVPWPVGHTDAYGGYDGPPFAIKAGEVQGVWIDLAIPYGTPAGDYGGALNVVAAGGVSTPLKLTVKVRDFDIPRRIHNTFFMNGGTADVNQSGGGWLQGDKVRIFDEETYRIARRHRFTCGNMYNNDHPRADETPDGELKSVDWSAYDAQYDKVLNTRKNLFGPGEDAIEIWKVPLDTGIRSGAQQFPKGQKAWDQMIAEIRKHWQEKNWDFSRAYVYLADEPGKELADKLNDYARRVKASPGAPLRRQIAVYTILGDSYDKQKWVFDLWKDNLDMWMVAGDYYHVPSMNALPAGSLKGMYQGAEPYQGNETLDTDGIALRSWSWVAWQYRIDYQCYYSMSEAWRKAIPDPKNPNKFIQKSGRQFENNDNEIWDNPRNRTWALSQGVFIYPGKKVNYDLPIVGIRMKQVRRGQTDFEYFWLLKQAGEEKLADSLCKGVINVALSEAASKPEEYGAGKWTHDPELWDAAVQQAGARLEQLKDKLSKEPAELSAKE